MPHLIENGPYTITFEKSDTLKFNERTFQEIIMPHFIHNKPIIPTFDKCVELLRDANEGNHSTGIVLLLQGYIQNFETWNAFIEVFKEREVENTDEFLIHVLAEISGHPEKFGVGFGPSDTIRTQVQPKLSSLSKSDIAKLISFIHDGIHRGSVGQSVETIIASVDNNQDILKDIVRDENLEHDIPIYASTILAYYQGMDRIPFLEEVMRDNMSLKEHISITVDYLEEWEIIELYA